MAKFLVFSVVAFPAHDVHNYLSLTSIDTLANLAVLQSEKYRTWQEQEPYVAEMFSWISQSAVNLDRRAGNAVITCESPYFFLLFLSPADVYLTR